MVCKNVVKVKDPYSHLVVTIPPEKVFVIRNHRGKEIRIGLFRSPKTSQYFRALLSSAYNCE
uniref:Chorismate-binding protein n=1 Tax=Ignisphaera aggregans TaxID=334771 RepID=A0A7C2VAW2_9CREN